MPDHEAGPYHCGHWHHRDEDTGAWIDKCCRCDATWAAWDGVPDKPCPALTGSSVEGANK